MPIGCELQKDEYQEMKKSEPDKWRGVYRRDMDIYLRRTYKTPNTKEAFYRYMANYYKEKNWHSTAFDYNVWADREVMLAKIWGPTL